MVDFGCCFARAMKIFMCLRKLPFFHVAFSPPRVPIHHLLLIINCQVPRPHPCALSPSSVSDTVDSQTLLPTWALLSFSPLPTYSQSHNDFFF